MKKRILLVLATVITSWSMYGQTAAENCISNLSVPSYISCGHNAAFNLSGEFTIEAWINPATFGDNRKLVGKTNNSFNSGFVFGLSDGLYCEFWQPGHVALTAGTLPAFYSWVHVAVTFEPGNLAIGYINGENVGTVAVGSSNLATNSDPLILGIAPWDFGALMYIGEMDEVRIWNVARTAAELKADMHKVMTGSEANLVALYGMNSGTGSTITNATVVSGIDGTLNGSGWATSYAVIGSDLMHQKNDVEAVWLGMTNDPATSLRVANTTNGLSVITVVDSTNYLMYGHDNATGVTADDLPQVALDESFQRTARTWYFEVEKTGENFKSQLAFNLTNAAGGGTELSSTADAGNYTLFHRADSTGAFTAMCAATQINAGTVLFDSVDVQSGYYAVGVGDNSLVDPCNGVIGSINEQMDYGISVFPNPAKDMISINMLSKQFEGNISLYNLLGEQVVQYVSRANSSKMDVSNLPSGTYMIRIVGNQRNEHIRYSKLVVIE